MAIFNGVEDDFIEEHIMDTKFDKEVSLEQVGGSEGKIIESRIGLMD